MSRAFANAVKFNTSTTGQGAVLVGAVYSAAYVLPAQAGLVTGDEPVMRIEEGADWELVRGTFDAGTGFVSRDTVYRSKIAGVVGATKMHLAGAAVVTFVEAAEDFAAILADLQTLGAAATGAFHKADPWSVAFVRTGLATISIKAGTHIELHGVVYSYDAHTAVQMPTHSVGAYFIYQCNDGSVRGDASAIAPVGFDATTSRQIGGYYYGPGGLATGYNTGGDTTPQILPPTLWDLKFRPSVADRRGWSFTGSHWVTLWLLNDNWIVNGLSAHGATIADGASPPKIPLARGGDGTATYGSLTQWEADEVYRSAGARLLDPLEFAAAAVGVVERTSQPDDPVTTQLDAPRTSMYMYQATGNIWVWGTAFGGPHAVAGFTDVTGGRGQVSAQPNAVLMGGYTDGVIAGSRALSWMLAPGFSALYIGARGRCDHVCHV